MLLFLKGESSSFFDGCLMCLMSIGKIGMQIFRSFRIFSTESYAAKNLASLKNDVIWLDEAICFLSGGSLVGGKNEFVTRLERRWPYQNLPQTPPNDSLCVAIQKFKTTCDD